MQPIWLKHYPQGVPAAVDLRRFASLKELFEQSCRKFHDRPAFTSMGATLTYAETDRLSRDFAAYLQGLGLKPGERVAIMLPNLLQYPVALFGALRAGLVVVNVNPLYTARELRHQLADSGAVAVVVLENFAHTLEEIIGETAVRHVVTTQIGDLFPPLKRCLVNFVVKRVKHMVPPWRLPGAARPRRQVRLRGLHPGWRYRLTVDNTGQTREASGAALRDRGVSVWAGAPGQSELLLLEVIEVAQRKEQPHG